MANHRPHHAASGFVGVLALAFTLATLALLAQQPPMPTPPVPTPPMPAPPGQQPAPPQPAPPAEQPQAAPPAEQPQAEQPAPAAPRRRGRRDPFRSLFARGEEGAAGGEGMPRALPLGKRGLTIGQVRLQGIVLSPTDRIAVVTVPDRKPAYFLRPEDELFNGYVAAITADSVIFKERAVDPFGRPFEREVKKQLSTPGATQ